MFESVNYGHVRRRWTKYMNIDPVRDALKPLARFVTLIVVIGHGQAVGWGGRNNEGDEGQGEVGISRRTLS
jgi:hypothetical protein